MATVIIANTSQVLPKTQNAKVERALSFSLSPFSPPPFYICVVYSLHILFFPTSHKLEATLNIKVC